MHTIDPRRHGHAAHVGIPGAGALHALDDHVEFLAHEHARAVRLGEALDDIAGCDVAARHSTMAFVPVPGHRVAALRTHMRAAGIVLSIGDSGAIRLVTHLDIDDAALTRVVDAFRGFATTH